MTHTPRHKAQSGRKQYTGSSKYTTKKATYSPEGFVDRPTVKPKDVSIKDQLLAGAARMAGQSSGISTGQQNQISLPSLPKVTGEYREIADADWEARYNPDPRVTIKPENVLRSQVQQKTEERDRVAQTIAQQEVAQVKAQREAEAKAVIAGAARDYYTRTQAVHYDSRQLKYQQYGDDRGSVVGRNIAMQGVQDAGADRKFQTTSQRLPTGGYIRQTQHAGVEVENMWQLADGTVTDKYQESARYIGNYPATHTTIWYSKDDTPESRMQPAADSVGFWNAVADRASDPAESYYRNNLADAAANKWEQIRNRKDLGIAEVNDSLIMNSLEKFYKETEHGLTPDDIGFEIIIPDDKVDTQDDTDSTVVVPTTITTSGPGGGGAGDGGGGGWDWGGSGSGGYGNYGGNVYNITYGDRGYEQRIDPWAYGMVQWRI
jgi:uncharacterized protein YgiM (DUF1202 family)